jgi:DNA-binding NarL/FixJ family response regulator
LRWIAIAFAGLAGLLGQEVPRFLTPEILAAVLYNGIVMGIEKRVPDPAVGGLALALTLIDQGFCFAFIALYSVLPGGHQVAAYVPAMVEAVAFFGTAGAALSAGSFAAAVALSQAAVVLLGKGSLDFAGGLASTMIVILLAICMGVVSRAMASTDGHEAASTGLAIKPARTRQPGLSSREQRVLELLAQGYSNSMIATRLGVSERAVKASVERVLARLEARNRAEAVAAAARLELL